MIHWSNMFAWYRALPLSSCYSISLLRTGKYSVVTTKMSSSYPLLTYLNKFDISPTDFSNMHCSIFVTLTHKRPSDFFP